MIIKSLQVGQMQENCYLVIDEENDDTLIIDPGDDADYISQVIADNSCKPVAILATHGHFDHVMAAFELQLAYDIPFYIHKKDQFLIDRMQETADYFIPGTQCPPPPQKISYWEAGSFEIDQFEFKLIDTPGHTPGSVSILFSPIKALFSGDVIFADGGMGRTDFKYARVLDLQNSISNLLKLDDDITIYPGHGQFTTIENEVGFWE